MVRLGGMGGGVLSRAVVPGHRSQRQEISREEESGRPCADSCDPELGRAAGLRVVAQVGTASRAHPQAGALGRWSPRLRLRVTGSPTPQAGSSAGRPQSALLPNHLLSSVWTGS